MDSHLLLVLSILFFGAVHSLTASRFFKSRVRWFKRAHYNVLSVVTILPVAYVWAERYRSSKVLYSIDYPISLLFYFFMAIGATLFILGAMEMDLPGFLGLREERIEISKTGAHGLVRHPLYLGLILIIWSFPTIRVIDVTGNLGITLYLVIGAFLEEAKLSQEFGEQYEEYKRQTPMFVPRLIKASPVKNSFNQKGNNDR